MLKTDGSYAVIAEEDMESDASRLEVKMNTILNHGVETDGMKYCFISLFLSWGWES